MRMVLKLLINYIVIKFGLLFVVLLANPQT